MMWKYFVLGGGGGGEGKEESLRVDNDASI